MQILAPFGAGLWMAASALAQVDAPICSDHQPDRQAPDHHPVACPLCQVCCQGMHPVALPSAPVLPVPAAPILVALRNHELQQPRGPPAIHWNARAPPRSVLA